MWQSYWHVLYTLIVCGAGILVPLSLLNHFGIIEACIVPISFVVANFAEYYVHRWPMHQRMPGGKALLKLHMVHHNYFYEDTYQINDFRDYAMIVFPPIVLNVVAFVLAPIFALITDALLGRDAALVFYASVFGYYLLMQLIHVLTHVNPEHWVARLPGIHFLWNHHYLHHNKRYMDKINFNFIVPLADIAMGTSVQSLDKIKK